MLLVLRSKPNRTKPDLTHLPSRQAVTHGSPGASGRLGNSYNPLHDHPGRPAVSGRRHQPGDRAREDRATGHRLPSALLPRRARARAPRLRRAGVAMADGHRRGRRLPGKLGISGVVARRTSSDQLKHRSHTPAALARRAAPRAGARPGLDAWSLAPVSSASFLSVALRGPARTYALGTSNGFVWITLAFYQHVF